MSPSSVNDIMVNPTVVLGLVLYYTIPIRQHTVVDVILHFDTLFQVLCCFYHSTALGGKTLIAAAL